MLGEEKEERMRKRAGKPLRRRAALVISAVLLGAAAASGIALATIPDSGGAIHACYTKSGGALRVIDNSVAGCKSSETSLSWNVAGQQGPPGPAGISGYETVVASTTVQAGGSGGVQARCPNGKRPLGGGFNQGGGLDVVASEPIVGSGNPGWEAIFNNATGADVLAVAYAICATVTP
jgi:hypothetical protein